MKFKDFINKLEEQGCKPNTDIKFGAYGGEEYFEFNNDADEFISREDPVFEKKDVVYVNFELPKDCIKSEFEYLKLDLEEELRDSVNSIILKYL